MRNSDREAMAQLSAQLEYLQKGIEVKHIIKREPEPRPVMGWIVITNEIGQQWRTNPFHVNGKAGMPIYVNRSWFTGRDEDNKLPPIKVELQLEY